MDIVTDDQELAQDLIKLLHAKLRQARQELQDVRRTSHSEVALIDSTKLKQQNQELREELSTLRFRLSAAVDNEDTKEHSFPATTIDTGNIIEERLQALRDEGAAEDLVKRQLESQIKARREKYKIVKDETDGLRELLSAKLEDLERETSKIDRYREQIAIAESDMSKSGLPEAVLGESLDVLAFLSNAQEMHDLPSISSLKLFLKSAPFRGLPQYIVERFGTLKLLVFPSVKEVIWSEDGVSRLLYVAPPYQYNPTANEGSRWVENRTTSDLRKVGDSQENLEVIVCQGHGSWYYYGTYQCVGYTSLSRETATALNTTVASNAMRTTAVNKDYLAPLALQFINTLYDNGPLALQCVGLQRTGFHHELSDALLSSKKAVQSIGSDASMRKSEKITTASLLTLQRSDQPTPGKKTSNRGRFEGPRKKSKKQG